jgi:hypothetical protein
MDMLRMSIALGLVLASLNVHAQPGRTHVRRSPQRTFDVSQIETIVKDASRRLTEQKKIVDADLEVLALLRAADVALTDPMQPNVALQKAIDHVDKAQAILPVHQENLWVRQGLISVKRVLDDARRSPGAADFGRLRFQLHRDCVAPATRVALKHSSSLQQELASWIVAQEWITGHLQLLQQVSSEAILAAQED